MAYRSGSGGIDVMIVDVFVGDVTLAIGAIVFATVRTLGLVMIVSGGAPMGAAARGDKPRRRCSRAPTAGRAMRTR
jgi:hypothetical protein